jgi:hypothetical protein
VPARDPHERSLQAKTASHASWAKCPDRLGRLSNAHSGRDAFIARQYGISTDLPPAEYALRLESAKKAYFAGLALKSVKARRRKAAERRTASSPDAGRQAA